MKIQASSAITTAARTQNWKKTLRCRDVRPNICPSFAAPAASAMRVTTTSEMKPMSGPEQEVVLASQAAKIPVPRSISLLPNEGMSVNHIGTITELIRSEERRAGKEETP